jgi:hypothetical protein
MNKEAIGKILEGHPSLIDFAARTPKFESELQIKEYEHALIDVHKSDDRRNLIHSKKGLQIVLLYMKVWQIPAHQAMRELIMDDAYTCYICP